MRRPSFGLKVFDVPIIVLAAAAAAAAGFAVYGGRAASVHLEIEAPGGKWVYGLDTDRTVSVKGPLGETLVEIHDGEAHIIKSPCPNQTCVAAPGISRKGEWNACLPNEIMIRVAGDPDADGGLDAIVY